MSRDFSDQLIKGNPLKSILLFAIPIYIGNLFQLTYGLMDTRIIGSILGETSLAAVGTTTSFSDFLIEFFNGVTCGFGIVIAKYIGAKEKEKVKKAIGVTVVLGVLITVMISCICILFLPQIMQVLNVSESLLPESSAYIRIIIAGLIATTVFNILTVVLRAIGDSFTPLLFLIVSNVLNIGMDYLFVSIFQRVEGAAIATVIAQAISAICCFLYMRKKYPAILISLTDLRMDKGMCGQLLPQGLSMGVMISFVTLGTLALQTEINNLSTDIIVAHTAARKITMIFLISFFALGTAMTTYCGQNLGAKEYGRIKKGIKDTILAAFCWCLVAVFVVYSLAPLMVRMITASNEPEMIRVAVLYLKTNSLFFFVSAIICILRNSMQGFGDTKTPLVSSFIELVGKVVIAIFLVPVIGYMGVVVSEPVVWIIMVVPLLLGMKKYKL